MIAEVSLLFGAGLPLLLHVEPADISIWLFGSERLWKLAFSRRLIPFSQAYSFSTTERIKYL